MTADQSVPGARVGRRIDCKGLEGINCGDGHVLKTWIVLMGTEFYKFIKTQRAVQVK